MCAHVSLVAWDIVAISACNPIGARATISTSILDVSARFLKRNGNTVSNRSHRGKRTNPLLQLVADLPARALQVIVMERTRTT